MKSPIRAVSVVVLSAVGVFAFACGGSKEGADRTQDPLNDTPSGTLFAAFDSADINEFAPVSYEVTDVTTVATFQWRRATQVLKVVETISAASGSVVASTEIASATRDSEPGDDGFGKWVTSSLVERYGRAIAKDYIAVTADAFVADETPELKEECSNMLVSGIAGDDRVPTLAGRSRWTSTRGTFVVCDGTWSTGNKASDFGTIVTIDTKSSMPAVMYRLADGTITTDFPVIVPSANAGTDGGAD